MDRFPAGSARVWPGILLALLALIAIFPLITHGYSCGHDFEFHLQSWLDAAAQMRHGTVDPAWTVSAAWNAGEPRFLFYPPVSWMLGALLALTMPLSAAPVVLTGLALAGAAAAMYLLARDYAAEPVAVVAAAVYIASPYMLFTAFERTAYGELLAAVWIPLLLRAALRRDVSLPGVALPLGLLWLTNAPAAVMGTYTLALVAVARIIMAVRAREMRFARALLVRFSAGGALGFALAAFYLVPAAYERKYVQVAMAIIANMRVEDNFLFGHTGDGPHDLVLHTASLIAVGMLAAALVVLGVLWRKRREGRRENRASANDETLSTLVLITVCIGFLLTPVSLLVWHHVPELAFLQFPWRLLCVLGATLALSVALALRPFAGSRGAAVSMSVAAIVLVAGMTALTVPGFRQPCEALDRPAVRAQLFATHHGVGPTDEYTPADADNDVLRWDDPGYWIAPNSAAFAPDTVANPAATIVNYDVPPPVDQTVSGVAPRHLSLKLAQPAFLIVNLRDYPAWQVFRNGVLVRDHLQRDDGLLAIALPAGTSTIDIRWHRTWDQWAGDAISVAGLLVLALLLLRSRTINRDA